LNWCLAQSRSLAKLIPASNCNTSLLAASANKREREALAVQRWS